MLLQRINRVSASGLRGEAEFKVMPGFTGLECMAQLATLHVRYCLDFDRHAFLLKVGRTIWPLEEYLSGHYHLTAERDSQSSHTFAYRVKAQNPTGGMLAADLLIGSKPYDDQFQEQYLKVHYRELFKGLRRQGG